MLFVHVLVPDARSLQLLAAPGNTAWDEAIDHVPMEIVPSITPGGELCAVRELDVMVALPFL